MYQHIYKECCNGDMKLFRWTLRYFAHMFQKPTEKPSICLVFYGEQGCGKDTLCTWLSYLLGQSSFIMTGDIRHFTKDFNAAYANKMLIGFNEVTSAKTSEISDILNHLFASETKRIEKKFHDAKADVPDFARHIANTNNRHAFNIVANDRRAVLYEWNNSKCQVGNVDRKYYNDLWAEVGDVNAQIDAFQYLKHLDIEDFNFRDIPDTKYKQSEREYNLDSVNQMLQVMYDIDSFDDRISELLKPHIRNLKPYMNGNAEFDDDYDDSDNDCDKEPEEIVIKDWKFDYEFTVNHLWEFYREYCADAGIESKYMKRKKAFVSQINSYRLGEKIDKKEKKTIPIYMKRKTTRPKCDKYKGKKTVKVYSFTHVYLKKIIVVQLRLKDTKADIEDDETKKITVVADQP